MPPWDPFKFSFSRNYKELKSKRNLNKYLNDTAKKYVFQSVDKTVRQTKYHKQAWCKQNHIHFNWYSQTK